MQLTLTMKLWLTVIIIVLILGVVHAAFILSSEYDNENGTLDTIPPFSLQDYNGNIVTSSDFPGKILVINSWASWCPFCINELPDFVELQKEFSENIVVIAIDRRESLETAQGFTNSIGISDDIVFLLDPKDLFYKSIGGFSMPETIFVNTEGIIRIHKRGPMQLEEMREKIQSII